ncbi:hypothetical protein CEE45_17625 [Candidatus Heimdallarchaeota archaeon B3_Heim]|nr:MAG: hypothetical protein CEE45_17625 [Candidatus Heimdallarchaeota archaeon B3_Heim]
MNRVEIIRKVLFILIWYFILYNLVFFILAPEIYQDTLDMIGVGMIFSIGILDTIIRPFSEKEREVGFDKYTGLLFIAFLMSPVILALSFHENQLFIAKYIPLWNSLPVALMGYLLLIIGGIFTIVGRWQIGKFGSGILVIEKEHQLMKEGIYKFVRHPIYAGGILGSFGSILIFRCLFFGSFGFLYNFFVLYVRLKQEEVILVEEFGEDYLNYMKTTKRLIPFLF